jgi:hypothetical protein
VNKMSLVRNLAVAIAVTGALMPSALTAAAVPSATKSGAIVQYLTTAKRKISKKIVVPFKCAVNCSVVSTVKLKGPSVKGADTATASLEAGAPVGHSFRPKRRALKLMQASPRKYHLVSTVTATDTSGAKDTISHTFGLRRSRGGR